MLFLALRSLSYMPVLTPRCVYLFVCLCAQLWTEFWGMAGALTISNPRQRLLGVKIRPWMMNLFALLYYLIAIPALVPDFAFAARTTRRMEHRYDQLHAWLSQQAAAWDGQSSFEVDEPLAKLVAHLVQDQKDFARQSKWFFHIRMCSCS